MGENRRKTLSTARGRGGVSTGYFHHIQVGMWAKLWDMSHLFVCFVALVIQGGAMAKFWPLHHYNQCMGKNRRKILSTACGRGGVSTCYFHQIQVGMWAKLWYMYTFIRVTETVNLYYLYRTNKMADLITPTIRIWARIRAQRLQWMWNRQRRFF